MQSQIIDLTQFGSLEVIQKKMNDLFEEIIECADLISGMNTVAHMSGNADHSDILDTQKDAEDRIAEALEPFKELYKVYRNLGGDMSVIEPLISDLIQKIIIEKEDDMFDENG